MLDDLDGMSGFMGLVLQVGHSVQRCNASGFHSCTWPMFTRLVAGIVAVTGGFEYRKHNDS